MPAETTAFGSFSHRRLPEQSRPDPGTAPPPAAASPGVRSASRRDTAGNGKSDKSMCDSLVR